MSERMPREPSKASVRGISDSRSTPEHGYSPAIILLAVPELSQRCGPVMPAEGSTGSASSRLHCATFSCIAACIFRGMTPGMRHLPTQRRSCPEMRAAACISSAANSTRFHMASPQSRAPAAKCA